MENSGHWCVQVYPVWAGGTVKLSISRLQDYNSCSSILSNYFGKNLHPEENSGGLI